MDDVQPYTFGTSEPQAPVSLAGMDRLGERMARQVRTLLEPIIGVKPVISAQSAEMVNYDLWSAMAPSFCSLSTYKLHPLKGMILVRLDAPLTWAVVDRYYGGTGKRPAPERTEFSGSEERLLSRLSDAVVKALIRVWADMLPMEMALVARESDPQALVFGDASDQLLSQSFTVRFEEGSEDSWSVEVLYPHVALRQLEPVLASHAPDEAMHRDPLWQTRLARQIGEVSLPAKSVLARPSLSLSELFNLKNGDVIPVSINRTLPLIIGNRVLAHGTIGEQNGRAAFRIETVSQGQTA